MSSPLADIQSYSAFVYSLRERHSFVITSMVALVPLGLLPWHVAAPIGMMLFAQMKSMAWFVRRTHPCEAGKGGIDASAVALDDAGEVRG